MRLATCARLDSRRRGAVLMMFSERAFTVGHESTLASAKINAIAEHAVDQQSRKSSFAVVARLTIVASNLRHPLNIGRWTLDVGCSRVSASWACSSAVRAG